MKSTYRLLLVAAVAVAVLASTAFGESSAVEVEDAFEGGHCPAVTLTGTGHEAEGGCELHAVNVGLIGLITHSSPTVENISFQCNREFDVNVNELGEGWVTHQVISPGQAGCGTVVRPCWESDPHIGGTGDEPVPWHLQIEETGIGQDEAEHAIVEECLIITVPNPNSPPATIECPLEKEVEVDLIRQPGSGYSAENGEPLADPNHFNPCGFAIEFEAHYTFEHDNHEEEHYTELDIMHAR